MDLLSEDSKKEQIKEIVQHYAEELRKLEQERNGIVSDFLNTVKEKKLEQIRNAIKKL